MARQSKDPEERRLELMEKAQELFFSRGYTRTSVAQITDALGVAKGTFYYYFDSKQDLLEQLAESRSEEVFQMLQAEVAREDLTALEKLHRIYAVSSAWKGQNRAMIKTLHEAFYREENLVFRYKMSQYSMEKTQPLLRRILQEGQDRGEFSGGDPDAVAEILAAVNITISEKASPLMREAFDSPEKTEQLIRKLQGYHRVVESLLGTPPGSVQIFDGENIRNILLGGKDDQD